MQYNIVYYLKFRGVKMGRDQHSRIKTLVTASMITAIIFLSTYYVKFPVPKAPGAYVNIGDSIIYIAGLLLSMPWAAGAAAIGSMLADIMYGGGWYIPATFVIKGLMGLVASLMLYKKKKSNAEQLKIEDTEKKKGEFLKFILVCILGGAIMVSGYFLFEWFVFGFAYSLGTIVFNLIQWAGGVIVAAILYYPIKLIKAAI